MMVEWFFGCVKEKLWFSLVWCMIVFIWWKKVVRVVVWCCLMVIVNVCIMKIWYFLKIRYGVCIIFLCFGCWMCIVLVVMCLWVVCLCLG